MYISTYRAVQRVSISETVETDPTNNSQVLAAANAPLVHLEVTEQGHTPIIGQRLCQSLSLVCNM